VQTHAAEPCIQGPCARVSQAFDSAHACAETLRDTHRRATHVRENGPLRPCALLCTPPEQGSDASMQVMESVLHWAELHWCGCVCSILTKCVAFGSSRRWRHHQEASKVQCPCGQGETSTVQLDALSAAHSGSECPSCAGAGDNHCLLQHCDYVCVWKQSTGILCECACCVLAQAV